MNKILKEKINFNLIQIIGIYLLPPQKLLLDLNHLLDEIQFINLRLDDHYIFTNDSGTIKTFHKNFDKCKITRHLNKRWVIRPKLIFKVNLL